MIDSSMCPVGTASLLLSLIDLDMRNIQSIHIQTFHLKTDNQKAMLLKVGSKYQTAIGAHKKLINK
jgi:hypothetical protein